MIRPQPTRWFEMLVARDDTTLALEALASTGAVELETRQDSGLPPGFADLAPLLAQFAELSQRLGSYWPAGRLLPSTVPEAPATTLARCTGRIRAWAEQAEPHIRRLQRARAERSRIGHWLAALGQIDPAALDLGLLARAGPQLRACLLRLGTDAPPVQVATVGDDAPLLRALEQPPTRYLLAVGTPAQIEPVAQQVLSAKGEVLEAPDWLVGNLQANRDEAARRLQALQSDGAEAAAAIDRLCDEFELRSALGDVRRLQWVLDNVRGLETGELFCWITGWTSLPDAKALEAAIERSGVRALFRLLPAPASKRAPLQLANPWWARPFEVFSRAMGMPADSEADPSVLLALAVPLMFGFMFGDVGQGLVIAAAGLLLRKRFAMARLFVAGGLSAAVFGLLFGSVFSLHLLHPWWVSPLEAPLLVLLVPLIGGAVLLSLGLLLSALGAFWRGELTHWFGTDAGLLLCYLGLLAGLVQPAAFAVALGGAVLFCAGHAWHEKRPLAALSALGELIERLLQLLINTLSFARVGAFALAHAGLSSAIVAMGHAAGHPLVAALVLIVGNVVVIVLEGLVVSIQTTRLVLFEFFARFLQGSGRVFRPLPLPPSALQET
jgi:V/A-type H+-transporting ATPase subunit I